MITDEIKTKFRTIVGAENALDSTIECFGYSYDSSFVPMETKNIPNLVVRPATAKEVSSREVHH